MRPFSVPLSTYRLQLSSSFTFADATRVTAYLRALGISHVYTSSYFKAVPGSQHGYDVADPRVLNPEIGDEEAHAAWIASLRAAGLGHIIDLVPNHMGIAKSANPWWQDVLENGESSRYAEVFDIDWHPATPELENRVLLPILGDTYGAVLERQEIILEYDAGAFRIRYFEQVLPIAPGTYDRILSVAAPLVLEELGPSSEPGIELLSILTAVRNLPSRQEVTPERRAERDREKEVIKRRLDGLTRQSPEVLAHIQQVVETFNGTAGEPASFDQLDALLSAQAYRLSYWRVAAEEINYRRFFDINELAAIRVEDPAVFDQTHAFVFSLLERGDIDGFRIDHVDGLYDPADYLHRVQERAQEARRSAGDTAPLYLLVEKILGHDEPLPDWPVAGTTGYDFLGTINGLFVDARNERPVSNAYEQFSRLRDPYREIVYRGKQLVLRVSMASELSGLAHRLNRLSEKHRHYRDFTINSLSQAMREIIACVPVYRTYMTAREAAIRPEDTRIIERAVAEAKRRNPARPGAVYDFVRDVLLRRAAYIPEDERDEHMRFIGKFQQVTSPVTARGIEDTALYIYNRLVSLNEVGSEPDRFGTPAAAAHAWLAERARRWPHSMSASSTHDTKRSEDVRARINVLSEVPGAWKQAAARWARANRRARSTVDGQSYPSRNEEYLLYQTLVGSWPLHPMDEEQQREYTARIAAYMQKAMREAKVYTSWLNPSTEHEEAMTRFVEGILDPSNADFRDDFTAFQRTIARQALFTSLSQLTIKACAPGVPDFYQGTELWDFSLVDPDNRRPVDYTRRMTLLQELESDVAQHGGAAVTARLVAAPEDDRLKLYTTMMLLRLRSRRRDVFDTGDYAALAVEGSRREHVFAFKRTAGTTHLLVVVPRLVAGLSPDGDAPLGEKAWGDTRVLLPALAGGATVYRHALTGEQFAASSQKGGVSLVLAEVFAAFPVAVLESE
jgi:(1->4)-alpha-D-glucan 1-alpha-D-glucosylmutase